MPLAFSLCNVHSVTLATMLLPQRCGMFLKAGLIVMIVSSSSLRMQNQLHSLGMIGQLALLYP